jgi:hypothetical protein
VARPHSFFSADIAGDITRDIAGDAAGDIGAIEGEGIGSIAEQPCLSLRCRP